MLGGSLTTLRFLRPFTIDPVILPIPTETSRVTAPLPALALREASPTDAEALALVGSATFLQSYAHELTGTDILLHNHHQHAPEIYTGWLTAPDAACCLVETPTGAPVGYAVLCPPDLPVPLEPGDLELKRIYVLHRFQGGGVGGKLLRWAMEEAGKRNAARLLIGVYGQNHPALAFYRHHGFEQIGTRRFQVGTTLHDDFVLAIRLKPIT